MYEAEEKWPERKFEKVAEPQEECKQVKWIGVLQEETKPDLFQLTKYSSFSKLRRVVAYVYRFINNVRSPKIKRVSGLLKVRELVSATAALVKMAQLESFKDDVQIVASEENHPVSQSIVIVVY